MQLPNLKSMWKKAALAAVTLGGSCVSAPCRVRRLTRSWWCADLWSSCIMPSTGHGRITTVTAMPDQFSLSMAGAIALVAGTATKLLKTKNAEKNKQGAAQAPY